MADRARIFEMAPRDGLQNEKTPVSTADKIRLVDLLSECGLGHIEVTSFVSPTWVPQMSDASEVLAGISRKPCVTYAALTPNLKGLERALQAKVDEVAIFAAASEGFSQKNINCSIAECLQRFGPVIEAAAAADLRVRGYVSCVIACPYDGPTAPDKVADLSAKLIKMGCYEVSLGDTIGTGTPQTVAAMLGTVVDRVPPAQLAAHFHDTNGQALQNVQTALKHGLRTFDSSAGGLGGCPYAPGAKGNVATEGVVRLLEVSGFSTGVDLDRLDEAARFARSLRRGE